MEAVRTHGLGSLLLLAAACAGRIASDDADPADVPDAASGDDAQMPDAPVAGLEPGTLDVAWIHGAPDCGASTDPEWQRHAYNATTIIFRQSKCANFEGPFVYLLVGADRALLLDTGATNTPGLRTRVRAEIGTKPLVVAHTHAHGDHVASDPQFAGQPATVLVGRDRGSVEVTFGLAPWPTATGSLELGDRPLDVLAIPGHEGTHIAIYDRRTGLLLTGDSLYPGMLFINDWDTYRTSIARLAQFAAGKPIAHVLGAHVEMTATAGVAYPYGTTYQPDEHVLQLAPAHLVELDAALTGIGGSPRRQVHDDFIVDPQ
jgi:hydroxyacylglutathione hydrolase